MPEERPDTSPIEPGALPAVEAPAAIWKSIETTLDAGAKSAAPRFRWWPIAAVTLAAMGVVAVWLMRAPKASWDVARLDGAPSVNSRPLSGAGKIEVGDWLQTDANSRAEIMVGSIGVVQVEPNSRLRLVVAKENEHRLALAHGEISARVNAPPRLFMVDTPSSTAVDLGCAYKMKVDEDGSGMVRVTLGYVSLEWNGRSSMIPGGASCRTKKGAGPGTPYFEDASDDFKRAVDAFDFERGGIDAILSQARVRDTLTLWHLMSRVPVADRPRVLDRIVSHAPLPKGVMREKALSLDPATMDLWNRELAWLW